MTDIANKGLRVAHVNRDKAGNIHAREGWIINPATEKKSTIKKVKQKNLKINKKMEVQLLTKKKTIH